VLHSANLLPSVLWALPCVYLWHMVKPLFLVVVSHMCPYTHIYIRMDCSWITLYTHIYMFFKSSISI